jgi:hypothetical protein
MRCTPWLLLAVLALAMPAPGQTATARYEPLLDNAYVDVSGLDLPPRRQASLYQNTHEVFWIALDDGSLTFVATDGTKTRLPLNLGDTRFFRSYQVRSVLNESAANVRAVVVEIKARGLASGACFCTDKVEIAICGCGTPSHLPEMWATGMGKIMVGGTTLAPEQSYERAAQRGETLLVALTPVQLLDEAADAGQPARIELTPGQVTWVKAGWHKFKNVGTAAARFVSFEF